MNNVHFMHNTCEWETPDAFYKALDAEFHFTVDVAASEQNHKCSRFYTAAENGLLQKWDGETVWCNPPYGRQIAEWVKKASSSAATSVLLIPARTDTRWVHDYIYNRAEIRFVKGRLKFGGSQNSAPFPSMVVIFRNES